MWMPAMGLVVGLLFNVFLACTAGHLRDKAWVIIINVIGVLYMIGIMGVNVHKLQYSIGHGEDWSGGRVLEIVIVVVCLVALMQIVFPLRTIFSGKKVTKKPH